MLLKHSKYKSSDDFCLSTYVNVGSEYRSWVLYYALPVMKGVLSPAYFNHLGISPIYRDIRLHSKGKTGRSRASIERILSEIFRVVWL